MSSEKTEAIVIRQADFSETSRVVTLFTHEFGKISAIAKGAKRLKGPFDAALDLLTHCRIVFIRKSSSSLDILTDSQVIQRFRPESKDLNVLYGGYYFAELLTSLTEEYDPHTELFDETVNSLNCIRTGENPKETIVRFELAVLREIGQLPSFDACMACGIPLTETDPTVFWVSQGGMICPKCRKQEYQQQPVQPGTIHALHKLSQADDESASSLIISPQQLVEMRRITASAISHILGHRPKMYRYLQN
ncbi:MAG: DNA repair protein RecO [Planctomycetaceae bacterium]|nr:DNA repair protein RecO [Planctomycetaceae bacterium]MBT6155313.1 DNA repair protein RecO [Planctomycetaceae bacterium]MBT6485191.1 DNA repair protein RecO [Planctomycetaceae bacterium]MBT6497124.1 DNA repair protein RecO [Planctomycetaceae bacterium]